MSIYIHLMTTIKLASHNFPDLIFMVLGILEEASQETDRAMKEI